MLHDAFDWQKDADSSMECPNRRQSVPPCTANTDPGTSFCHSSNGGRTHGSAEWAYRCRDKPPKSVSLQVPPIPAHSQSARRRAGARVSLERTAASRLHLIVAVPSHAHCHAAGGEELTNRCRGRSRPKPHRWPAVSGWPSWEWMEADRDSNHARPFAAR